MSDINTVKAQIQSLIDLANTTTGNQDTNLTDGVNALVGGYGQGGSGGSLEGLENGYDVMFYDENNEGLAFYSIRQGNSINPPPYNCKNWENADAEIIEFPYTPTEDVILYANNSTLASTLYKHYGVDAGTYPYCWIIMRFKTSYWIGVGFSTELTSEQIPSGSFKCSSQVTIDSTTATNIASVDEMMSLALETVTTVNSTTSNHSLGATYKIASNWTGKYHFSGTGYIGGWYDLNV